MKFQMNFITNFVVAKQVAAKHVNIRIINEFLSNYLKYFYRITCKAIYVISLLHSKAKGSLFIINMSSGFNRNGCCPMVMGNGTMVRYMWMWRSHCNWKVHL
jgi:hypothetical protein